MSKIIDLSIEIKNNMPFYPGDPKPKLSPALSLEKDGCRVTKLDIGSHTGTHMDAPSHFIKNGKTIDEISLTHCMGKAVILNLTNLPPSTKIMPDHCNLEDLSRNDIEIALFHTNWTEKFGTEEFYSHPFLSGELCQLLVKAGIKAVGVDMLSVDKSDSEAVYNDDTTAAHEVLLKNNIVIVENLTNLDEITVPNPYVIFTPLKISGADGSPVRAYAIEDI